MKTHLRKSIMALTLLSILGIKAVMAGIANVEFERVVDLMEQGSNLITF